MTKIVDKKTLLNAIDVQWNLLLPEIKESFLKEPFFDLYVFINKAADTIKNDSEFDKDTFVKNSDMKDQYHSLVAAGGISSIAGSSVNSYVDREFFGKFSDIRDELMKSPEYWGNLE